MPWTEWTIMDQREQFIRDWVSGEYTKVALCAGYGISRPTGDKWLARYHAQGVAGLADLGRRPHTQPHQTPDEVVAAIVAMKQRHPSFGPKKIRDRLRDGGPGASVAGGQHGRRDSEAGGFGATPAATAAGACRSPSPDPGHGHSANLECRLQGRF